MIGHLAGKTYETRGNKDGGLCRGIGLRPRPEVMDGENPQCGMKPPLRRVRVLSMLVAPGRLSGLQVVMEGNACPPCR